MRAFDYTGLHGAELHMATVLERELALRRARRHLMDFTRYRMPKYVPYWHHRVMSDKLTAFAMRKIRRLIILVPPQHGKTELASRNLPAFLHGLYPDDRIICGTYNSTFATGLAMDVQRIMDTREYHDVFPHSWITPEGTVTRKKRNSKGHELIPIQLPNGKPMVPEGSYSADGVGGTFTGKKADWGIIDDPVKNRKDADSEAHRLETWQWYQSTFRSRLQANAGVAIIMTPWHGEDLANKLIKLAKDEPAADQWEVLRLPCFRDDMNEPLDPRRLDEVLWPEVFPREYMLQTKASVGSREWSALYQCRPTPPGGFIFKREWMKFYTELPSNMELSIQSWDLSFDEGEHTSFVVGGVWGRLGANKYLMDLFRARVGFNGQVMAIRTMTGKWPHAMKKIVEKKANGAAVITLLQNEIPGMVPWTPHTSKVARAEIVAPQFEAGNIWLPHPNIAPWVHDYIEELVAFPAGADDDQVDMTSQALIDLAIAPSYDAAPISLTKKSTFMGR